MTDVMVPVLSEFTAYLGKRERTEKKYLESSSQGTCKKDLPVSI